MALPRSGINWSCDVGVEFTVELPANLYNGQTSFTIMIHALDATTSRQGGAWQLPHQLHQLSFDPAEHGGLHSDSMH